MKCPVDGTTLVVSERQGVEIDYCPDCRGVWLDRGELDKVIERSNTELSGRTPGGGDRGREGSRDEHRSTAPDPRWSSPPKKKRKSFFSELFEGGDD